MMHAVSAQRAPHSPAGCGDHAAWWGASGPGGIGAPEFRRRGIPAAPGLVPRNAAESGLILLRDLAAWRPGSGQMAAASFAGQAAGTQPQPGDMDFAALSAATYGDAVPEGWSEVTPGQMAALGIDASMFSDVRTGFAARMYVDEDGHYVVAYRGSDDLMDWIQNVAQGAGTATAQYHQAAALAEHVHGALSALGKGDDLVFTGHSLGGGLASLAAMVTGAPAVTFNAAGVHDTTLLAHGVDPAQARQDALGGQIRAYRTAGEPLTGLQEDGILAGAVPDALGVPIRLAPADNKHWIPDEIERWSWHNPQPVIDALEKAQPWA